MSVEALASSIAARPEQVAALLEDELARGRVSRTERGGYSLVVEAFDPDVLEALTAL